MTAPRPRTISAEALAGIAGVLVDRLIKIKGHLDESQRDDAIRDIARCASRYEDGYGIARELDARAGWDCDLQMAEELDSFASLYRGELKLAEEEWAKQNAIEPPYPIGARVRWSTSEAPGTITEICSHAVASYVIKVDGDEGEIWRHIVRFEDVALAEQVPT